MLLQESIIHQITGGRKKGFRNWRRRIPAGAASWATSACNHHKGNASSPAVLRWETLQSVDLIHIPSFNLLPVTIDIVDVYLYYIIYCQLQWSCFPHCCVLRVWQSRDTQTFVEWILIVWMRKPRFSNLSKTRQQLISPTTQDKIRHSVNDKDLDYLGLPKLLFFAYSSL